MSNSTFAASARVMLGAVCAAALLTRPAHADGLDSHESVAPPRSTPWTLPLELGNAAAWTRARRGPVYQFRAGILPGWVPCECFTLHAVGQVVYRNPGWDMGIGGRPVFKLFSLNAFAPVSVLAEASWLPLTKGGYVTAGLMVGLGRLLYVAGLGGYETDRRTYFVGLRLGTDLLAWGDPVSAVTRDVPQTGAPPP
jgi:hypothetical protein